VSAGLEQFRSRLDELDEQIARLLGERFEVCREVAYFKSEHEIPMMQPERVATVRARYLERGDAANLPAEFTADLFELLINATCKLEDELMGTPVQERVAVPGPEEQEQVGGPGPEEEEERVGVSGPKQERVALPGPEQERVGVPGPEDGAGLGRS
jgi:4-amino-4-deoxychorismate mutase